MSFEFDPNRPIYLQIVEEIKKRAVRGLYSPGDQLPSVRDMARDMSVNPNTMSRAYMELEREGFIATRRGQGSFITEERSRIEAERQGLAGVACDRFVAAIGELDLATEQIDKLLRDIREAVDHDRN